MVCRLCLKDVPDESVIKLYHDINSSAESIEMVKLIEKYLEIEVRDDDVFSTTICQDCHDHLDDFHKFCKDVAEKQSILRNEFLEVQLKVESHCDDSQDPQMKEDKKILDSQVQNVDVCDSKEIEQAMFECPIDLLKSEADDDEKEEQEVFETDVLDDMDLNREEEEDVFADSVDNDPVDMNTSEDDMPLSKLKAKKKNTTARRKRTSTKPKVDKEVKEPKERKKKGERKKTMSAQEIIATSIELKCDICQVKVNTWRELRQHFLLAHTRTPYIKCCDTVYEKQRPLVEHLLWHKNPDSFKCKLCNEVFSNSRDLTSHISSQHPDNVDLLETYECEHCFKHFRNYTIFQNHLRTHSKDKDIECQICNKRLETEYQLRRHIDSFHKDMSMHICDICGKKFKCKDSFKRHYQVHQGIVEPAVQCSICKSWLKNQHSLRIHRFVHEEHPNSCNVCGKLFKTRHTLRRHMKYWHELERNLHCTYCDKVFRQQRNLEEHMATHTGAQLYTCPHCGKESRSRSNMYVHIKRVHPKEWWQSKVERLNLDPNTEHPEIEKYRQQQHDVLKMYDNFLCK
ncbi:transcription factor grauzone [Musca domestica]|uniref:Transcription factor grauzone n=1 Tax=Musca domestica TaxID=7370 RepID=A0A1I8ML73_MUSDO|nr:transcription factor grauzone [Musca domestica]